MDQTKNAKPIYDPIYRLHSRLIEVRLRNEQRTAEMSQDMEVIVTFMRKVLAAHIPANRLTFKDTLSYLSIQLDASARKTICRFYFGRKKYIGFLTQDKKLEKIHLIDIAHLRLFKSRIIAQAHALSQLSP